MASVLVCRRLFYGKKGGFHGLIRKNKGAYPPLGEHDEAVWSQTEDGERLDVLRAYTVPVTADGAMQELTVTGTHTTAELLERAGLTYTADDLLTPAADEIVPEGSGITVQRVTYNEYTVDEVVPTEIEEIPTSLFYRKQSKVMTLEEGHDGQDTVVYREKWIDGEWAETNEIERVNEAEMVPTVQKTRNISYPDEKNTLV